MIHEAFNTPRQKEPKFETLDAPVVRGKGTVEYDFFEARRPSGVLVVLWHGWLGHKTLRHVAHEVRNDGHNVVLIGREQREAHSMVKHAVQRTGETDAIVWDHSDGHRGVSKMLDHQRNKPDDDLTYRIRAVMATAPVGTNGKGVNFSGLHREFIQHAKLLRNHPLEEFGLLAQSIENGVRYPLVTATDAIRAIVYRSRLTAGVHDGVTVTETYFENDFVIRPPDDTSDVLVLPGSHVTPIIDPDVAREAIRRAA
jgi:hypothetical protein